MTIFECLAYLLDERYLAAIQCLYRADVSLVVESNPDLNDIVTNRDLAGYIVVISLAHMQRLEMKQQLLKSSSVLTLLELFESTNEIFDNFFNGRFDKLGPALATIRRDLATDYFFSTEHIFRQIRQMNLKQYVAPYKALDMREIAQAFGISLEEVEDELASLIASGDIKAKIDSYGKIIYAKKVN